MKKALAILLSLAMIVVLFAACGDKTPGNEEPTPANANTDQINVCIASEPDHIDPALNSAVDGATMIAHLFTGLSNWAQDENGALEICA